MSDTEGSSTTGSDGGQPWGPPGGGDQGGDQGFGQGGGPQYSAPPPWAPGPQPGGWYPQPTPAKTSGMAIAALVLGILWLCGLGSIVAIILGIVAIKKINRSQGELGGRGLAIGGIATGAAGLLLVLPIIAAIAIPVFLNQREMAWDAAARSDLRNAAVIQESHYVEASTYASDIEDLEAEGYNGSADVELTIVTGGQSSYCMEAKHRSSTQYWYLDSSTFQPSEGRC